MAPERKHDYDGDDFFDTIYDYASQAMTDREIAEELGLDEQTFNCMKNGNYIAWNTDENAARSERILKVLTRARNKINIAVRGTYLKAALGSIKPKSRTVVTRHMVVDGKETDEVLVQTSETESEMAPNIQALSTWMYHHDPKWRSVQRGTDEDESLIPQNIQRGIDIKEWIKKEMEDAGD